MQLPCLNYIKLNIAVLKSTDYQISFCNQNHSIIILKYHRKNRESSLYPIAKAINSSIVPQKLTSEFKLSTFEALYFMSFYNIVN